MNYSSKTLKIMHEGFQKWEFRRKDLTLELLKIRCSSPKSHEFLWHGALRRLRILGHTVDRVFDVLPPEENDPKEEALLDATAYLHAFYINTFGIFDNLARIWCLEAHVRGENGKPLPAANIGLGPKYVSVRNSLSKRFRKRLAERDAWFEYLENYRHALAHRIPLYIPPRQLSWADGREYERIQKEINQAIAAANLEKWQQLLDRQSKLGKFVPAMMHSFEESATPMRLHPQVISDLATVIEIGEHMAQELTNLIKS